MKKKLTSKYFATTLAIKVRVFNLMMFIAINCRNSWGFIRVICCRVK